MRILKKSGLVPFLLAALLVSLAMDFPQTLWPFIFVCLTPILWYRETHALNFWNKREVWSVFLKMLTFGFIFAVASTPWFASTYPLTWLRINDPALSISIIVVIWAGFAMAMSLPMTLWIFCLYGLRTNNRFFGALIGASAWILLEYVRSWFVALSVYGQGVLFGPHHTYYSLAYVIAGAPVLRDMLPVGGMYLTSFVVVLINVALFDLSLAYKRGSRVGYQTINVWVLIVGIIVVSFVGMKSIRSTDKSGTQFTATVVNTYLPSTIDAQISKQKSAIAMGLIAQMNNPDGIIVLPENLNVMTPFINDTKSATNPMSKDHLVIGSFPGMDSHNMYFFEPQTRRVLYYGKQLLMPIGEYSVAWVRFLIEQTHNDSWLSIYDKTTQNEPASGEGSMLYGDRTIKDLVLAGSICAENISPYIYQDETRLGATVLLNIASLSPFRNSQTLSRQTIAIDTTRALENGRYFIVASNDNRSFVVRDTGDIENITNGQEVNSFFNAGIQTKNYITPYVNYGDYILYFAFAVLLVAVVWLVL